MLQISARKPDEEHCSEPAITQPPRGKIGATTRLSTSPNRKCKRTIQQRWHSHARHRSDGSYTHIAGGTDPELERKGQPQHWISAAAPLSAATVVTPRALIVRWRTVSLRRFTYPHLRTAETAHAEVGCACMNEALGRPLQENKELKRLRSTFPKSKAISVIDSTGSHHVNVFNVVHLPRTLRIYLAQQILCFVGCQFVRAIRSERLF